MSSSLNLGWDHTWRQSQNTCMIQTVLAGPGLADTSAHWAARAFLDAYNRSSRTTPQQALRKVNDRFLNVVAIDANKLRLTGETETVWQCETLSSGRSEALRNALNHMLIPTFAHFGKDTGKAVTYTVSGNNLDVRELRFAFDPRFSGSSFRSAAGIEQHGTFARDSISRGTTVYMMCLLKIASTFTALNSLIFPRYRWISRVLNPVI